MSIRCSYFMTFLHSMLSRRTGNRLCNRRTAVITVPVRDNKTNKYSNKKEKKKKVTVCQPKYPASPAIIFFLYPSLSWISSRRIETGQGGGRACVFVCARMRPCMCEITREQEQDLFFLKNCFTHRILEKPYNSNYLEDMHDFWSQLDKLSNSQTFGSDAQARIRTHWSQI